MVKCSAGHKNELSDITGSINDPNANWVISGSCYKCSTSFIYVVDNGVARRLDKKEMSKYIEICKEIVRNG